MEELEGKSTKSKKGFVDLGKNRDITSELSKLSLNQMKLLYKVFISKEINDKTAVKWRLYQYLKYYRGFSIKNIQVNRSGNSTQVVDFIAETEKKEVIFFACIDVLEIKNFNTTISEIAKFAKKQKKTPDQFIIATNKVYRNIPIDTPFKINDIELTPELWVEYNDDQCPFNGLDLLLIDNTELNLAGFNFTNADDMLDYIYNNSEGGQVSILKNPGFFSEYAKDVSEKELIWKGIMLKQKI
jgi:hypothetical protein